MAEMGWGATKPFVLLENGVANIDDVGKRPVFSTAFTFSVSSILPRLPWLTFCNGPSLMLPNEFGAIVLLAGERRF